MMQTILIYDTLEGEIRFRVVDGDYSHLNGKYINSTETTDEEETELHSLLFYPEGHEKQWDYLEGFVDEFPIAVIEQNPGKCKVVTVGSIP